MDVEIDIEKTTEDNKYFILKGRFKSNSLNFYGLFLVVFNRRKDLELCHSIISTYSSIYELETHFSWEKYQELIVNSKWKGNYNPSMSTSIQELFDKLTTDKEEKMQLYELIKSYNYDNIDPFIFDIINRVIHDKNLILETSIQEVSASEYRDMKESDKKSKDLPDKTGNGYQTEDDSVTLGVQLILAPVSGKPIYELKIGDKIMTKIIPNTDKANYFIDLLDLRVEDHIKPVPSKIIEIKSDNRNDPLELLTQIGPGIYGKCFEDERQVKLRMYDPAMDVSPVKKDVKPKKEITQSILKTPKFGGRGIPKITLLIGGLVILMLTLILILILYT